jgi:hypothetical protein
MNKIWKFPLKLDQREIVYMPDGAKILTVVIQNDMPVLYAQVNPEAPARARIIRTVTTGDEFNSLGCTYIGTIQAGSPTWFIAHIFEQHGKASDPVDKRWRHDFKQIRRELRDNA